MKYILIILGCFPVLAFGQQLRVDKTIGIAISEFEDAKRFSYVRGTQLAYELHSKSNSNFLLSAGYYKTNFNTDDSVGNHFSTATFVTLSVRYKMAYYTSRSTSVFYEAGPFASHLWDLKTESNSGNTITERKEKHLGFNYGLSFRVGIKSHFTGKFSLGFALGEDFDIITSYRNKMDKLKNASTYLAFSFYMSL